MTGILRIPNQELEHVFQREIVERRKRMEPSFSKTYNQFRRALVNGQEQELQTQLEQYLMETANYYDTTTESFYHGLVLGLCSVWTDYYRVTSNRESGTGRFDIQLQPYDTSKAGILIEAKLSDSEANLESRAEEAIRQIEEKHYDANLHAFGISNISAYGVAFYGKQVVVKKRNI